MAVFDLQITQGGCETAEQTDVQTQLATVYAPGGLRGVQGPQGQQAHKATVQDLRDETAPGDVSAVWMVSGATEKADGGGGTWAWHPTSVEDDNLGTVLLPTGSLVPGRWHRQFADGIVSITWFAPAANADAGEPTDDSDVLIAALTAASGGTLHLEPGAEYHIEKEIVVPEHTTLDMQGAKLLFDPQGETRCLVMMTGSTVINGEIESTYLGGGYDDKGAPICIGDFGDTATLDGGTGASHVRVENMTIFTFRQEGSGIVIAADSHDVIIRNIDFPTSSTLGKAVLAKWGGGTEYDAGPSLPPGIVTTHPYNLLIDGITINQQSLIADDTQAAVFVSGAYNVTVRNVKTDLSPNFAMVNFYSGDFGFRYADAVVAARGCCNLVAENCVGFCHDGVRAHMRDIYTVPGLWDSTITLRNITNYSEGIDAVGGLGEITTCVIAYNVSNVLVENCLGLNAYWPFHVTDECANITFESCIGRNAQSTSFQIGLKPGDDLSDIKVLNCRSENCNISLLSVSVDIYFGYVSGGAVQGCVMDSPFVHSSLSIGYDSGATCEYIRVVDNHTVEIDGAEGPAFLIGAFADSFDPVVVSECRGNHVDLVPAGGAYGGIGQVPMLMMPGTYTESGTPRVFYSERTVAPTEGTWVTGDIILKDTPTPGGQIGFICTTGGTPGTWKAWGDIQA